MSFVTEPSQICLWCRVSSWIDATAPQESKEQFRHDELNKYNDHKITMPLTPPSTSPSKRRRLMPSEDSESITLRTANSIDSDITAEAIDDPTPRAQRGGIPPCHTLPSSLAFRPSASQSQGSGSIVSGSSQSGSGLTPRRRSVSPVKKTNDLRKLAIPTTLTPLTAPKKQLPPSMLTIYKRIEDIMHYGDPFAPAEVQSAINDIMQAAGEREWPAGWFEQQADTGGAVAERELERILEIQTLAAECSSEKVSEATWNLEVHGPLLKLAMTAIRGVSRHLITTARIESKWLPITRISPGPLISASESGSIRCSGNTVGGKMVDFALTLDTASTPLAVMKEHIYASDLSADLSVNQTTYNPLTLRPIGVSVETKASAAGAEQGRIQLALWTIAWYKRVQAWVDSCADDIRLPDAMPVILVTEHAWNLAFVCNRGGEAFELVYEISIGSTSNLRDLYKLLAVLRILGHWIDTDLRQWFERLFRV
ncbi:hypothetical protein ACKVV1_011425 [Pyricularia oryzae]